jgi:Fe-S-cluster-containing dehydrogenase component
MDEKPEVKPTKDRRKFLQKIGLLGAASIVGGGALVAGGYSETQTKVSMGKIRLLTQDNQLVEVDRADLTPIEKASPKLLQTRGRVGIPNRRWVMVIDLSKCQNARKCVSACQGAHQLKPEQYHINVLQMQEAEKTAPFFMPKPCQHCDNPPCVSVCPVDATFKRQDGVVLIDNERCIGCRFCMAACPYSARVFHWFDPKDAEKYKNEKYNVELNVPQKKGTISKCLFSADHLREGQMPYCVAACPNGVYYFGDENEDAVTNGTTKETVKLSKLLRDNGGYRLMEELGTKPRVYYLPPKNRTLQFPTESIWDNNHA